MESAAPWSLAGMLLFLVAGAAWLWTRQRGLPGIQRNRSAGPVQVLQRVPLTPQHSLHLVRAGDETVWIVTHPHGAFLHSTRTFSAWLAGRSSPGREELP